MVRPPLTSKLAVRLAAKLTAKLTGVLAGTLVLAACGSSPQKAPQARADREAFQVVTTVLPITLFTRAVAGDCAAITPLIPANSGPHDFQAKPGDLSALRQARVLVKNGLQLEGFLDQLVASAGHPRLVVIDASRGVTTLDPDQHPDQHAQTPGRSAAPNQPQNNQPKSIQPTNNQATNNHAKSNQPKSNQPKSDQTEDHHAEDSHAENIHAENIHAEDQHHGHQHGAVNPHVWLDPLRAVQQVETIRDGLAKADPGCAEGYRRNASAYIAQLKQLHTQISAQLKPYRGQTFVAFHDFAPYFAERYGLQAVYLVDVPELNPSPADLQRVVAEVKRSRLQALLSEPQEGKRSFNALAADLGVKVVEFDPLETGSDAASRDPATYFKVMRANVAELRQAFKR